MTEKPLSQGQLIWRRFRRHKLGALGGAIIAFLVIVTLFAHFISPYDYATQRRRFAFAPPTKVHFFDKDGRLSWPFVYGITRERDPRGRWIYREDTTQVYPIKFFVKGDPYRLFWLIPTDIHLFGTGELDPNSPGQIFLFGTDDVGRDLFSRTLIGGWVSLSIGPLALAISLTLAIVFGGISGYFGGGWDNFIQRTIEVLNSFPGLPLLLALAAILPPGLPPAISFLLIIAILSVLGWGGTARALRGLFLVLREQEFALAAKAMGASNARIIFKHLLPNTLSYLIVSATLGIPGLILAEASLSFLGFGIRDPMTSWGQLLNQFTDSTITNLTYHPWLMIPGFFIIIAVLAFNFMGDALRDATDPFSVQGRGS
jgi:peptide/nickel transport system permease protein